MTAPPRPASGDATIPAVADRATPREEGAKANRRISRRTLLQAGLIAGAGAGAVPLLAVVGSIAPSNMPQPTNLTFSLNSNWLFGGQYMAGSESSFYNDSGFAPVTLPHTVTPLSWRNWNAEAWQQMWIYRRHFSGAALVSSRKPGNRIMVDFDGVMVNATVVINNQTVSTHQGGYLPFSAELTGHVSPGENLLSVLVDANCLPVPPMGYGGVAASVDFFQPGGIYRDVTPQGASAGVPDRRVRLAGRRAHFAAAGRRGVHHRLGTAGARQWHAAGRTARRRPADHSSDHCAQRG